MASRTQAIAALKDIAGQGEAPVARIEALARQRVEVGRRGRFGVGRARLAVEKRHFAEEIAALKAQKTVADKHGLRLVAYEAGQHFLGSEGLAQLMDFLS